MKRRQFVKSCVSTAAMALLASSSRSFSEPLLEKTPDTETKQPSIEIPKHVELLNLDGSVLKSSKLAVGQAHLFYYPFVSTPAILVNVGQSVSGLGRVKSLEGDYSWDGGCGRGQNIIAFSAISPHQLTYPTKELNLISYRHKKSGYYAPKDNVITCCSHGSAFDTLRAGQPILGPSKIPLTAIKLAHNPQEDSLEPVGFSGFDIFPSFLKAHRRSLYAQFGKGYRQKSLYNRTVSPLDSFAEKTVRCS